MSTQLGEIANPTLSDRFQAFYRPLRRPEDVIDPDTAPRIINAADFDDVVLILEALTDALQARQENTKASDSTETMIEQLTQLVTDLTAAGGEVDRNNYGAGEEWKTDLRYLLAMGADPRYKDR